MTFGQPVTQFDRFLSDTYGYILRLNTAPSIRKITSIQVKNDTTISDVTEELTSMNSIMQYPMSSEAPDLAIALESGVIYLFLKESVFPYEYNTQFFIRAYRFPDEITSLDGTLDISPSDVELFIALSIAIAAETQGKLIPQRVLDKIEYLKNIITLESQ